MSARKVEVTVTRRKSFEDELARIVRRANRLRAALTDSADVKAVDVKKATVPEHTRVAHTRYIVVRRKK